MYPDCEKEGEQNAKLVKSAQNTAMLYGQKKRRAKRAPEILDKPYFLISLWSVLRLREGLYFIFSTFSCVLRKLRDVM